MITTLKQRKMKFKPRIKLNHNMYNLLLRAHRVSSYHPLGAPVLSHEQEKMYHTFTPMPRTRPSCQLTETVGRVTLSRLSTVTAYHLAYFCYANFCQVKYPWAVVKKLAAFQVAQCEKLLLLTRRCIGCTRQLPQDRLTRLILNATVQFLHACDQFVL